MFDLKSTIEIISALMMPIGLGLVMAHRFATGRAIGARTIQFTAIILLLPILLILALERILDSQILGTLVGGLMGYLLSGIANYDKPGGSSGS